MIGKTFNSMDISSLSSRQLVLVTTTQDSSSYFFSSSSNHTERAANSRPSLLSCFLLCKDKEYQLIHGSALLMKEKSIGGHGVLGNCIQEYMAKAMRRNSLTEKEVPLKVITFNFESRQHMHI